MKTRIIDKLSDLAYDESMYKIDDARNSRPFSEIANYYNIGFLDVFIDSYAKYFQLQYSRIRGSMIVKTPSKECIYPLTWQASHYKPLSRTHGTFYGGI